MHPDFLDIIIKNMNSKISKEVLQGRHPHKSAYTVYNIKN
jgi:hypothetical protein